MKQPRFVSIQGKLSLVFTVLFVIGVLLLAGFLRTSAGVMGYNADARLTYAQARQLYQSRVYLQQCVRALKTYELTTDYDALTEYQSSYARLQQSLSNLPAESGQAQLDRLNGDLQTLRQQFDRVIGAVDEEDWDTVAALDAESQALVASIDGQIAGLIQARSQALSDLRSEVAGFTRLAWLTIALALPAFVVIVFIVVLIVARQLHAPLIRLGDELKQIQAAGFEPAALGSLPERRDEVGYLAREYLHMASAVQNRQAALRQEAADIRGKIR